MRISTLMAVILTLVILNVEVRYNCEVRMSHIHFVCACDLIGHDPKAAIVFLFVSKPTGTDAHNLNANNDWHSCIFWSPVLWVSGPCLRFSLDCAPHVRPVPLVQSSSLELGTHRRCQSCHLERENYHGGRRWCLGDQRYFSDSR